jgi:uncharacterized protein YbaP (TraB family)
MHRIVYLVFFALFFRVAAQEDSSNYQLLWEVSGNGLNQSSFVFGSMHSNDARLFRFPDSLYHAFVHADAVVLETDISAIFDEYDVRINGSFFQSKRTITNSKSATSTVYGSEDGRPQFLDAYFQQTGYCAGKSFFQLESLQDQMDAMAEIGEMSTVSALNSLMFSKETFVNAYIQGDIAVLSRMLKAQLGDTPGAYEALITKRNRVMVMGLDSLMRSHAVFCAIGSGHLYGSDGVLHLLRAKGYTVRAVKPTYTSTPFADKTQMMAWKNYSLKNDSLEFELQLSGKPIETSDDEGYNRWIYKELGQGNAFELIVYSDQALLEDLKTSFIVNATTQLKHWSTPDGVEFYEGVVNDYSKGLQWKRIVLYHDRLYEMTCYGGNKFMHSNRPETFFNKLKLL